MQNTQSLLQESAAKILIADDSRSQCLLLTKILEQAGYQVFTAKDGLEAVRLFKECHPDLIILDILMPNMDGLEAAELIKKELDEQYVPIIFITELNSNESLQRCIDVGADDFVHKPFRSVALMAKIHSLLYVKQLYLEQFIQKKQLIEYQQHLAQEEAIAATLYKNIIHAGFLEVPEARYFLSPMALFNGDVFLVAKTPGNQLYVFLGDFTGHGLSASFGSGPVAEIFYGMTAKGFGITEIIAEINRKMKNLLPINMFLAATIVAFFRDTETINLITCGLPDHYLCNSTSKKLRTIKSKNLPLGIVDSFEAHPLVLQVSADDYLYLFTDGVIEAENIQGEPFDASGVIESIKHARNGYDAVLAALNKHSKGLEQQDDITLVELQCNVTNAKWMQIETKTKHNSLQALPWKTSMEFQAATLKHVNPVPIIINSIMEIQNLLEQRETIFLIVTELFANALDHGLLKLDSQMKQTPDGFMQFYNEREQRLNQLQAGAINLHFNHQPTAKGGRLVIKVQDTGEGFDYNAGKVGLADNQQNFGRGMSLLQSLCKNVEYSGNGNHVKAVYEWEA
ncbi:MAG: two-component system, HptB-dependent secretion and biofilm response regulator [Methyloprofundus sp.]|nr:MAG: two-component system, HptB-dependent secretion and biofilm response regulator [Methyloprofundus sp.]